MPPVLNFRTPIYHPNVDERGRICISSLNNEWQPEFTASIILSQVRFMLSNPELEYFLNPSIVSWLVSARVPFLWMKIYRINYVIFLFPGYRVSVQERLV